MISTFQGCRFQRWRQTSLWTAKKIRRQRIRGITRRRSESNARGASESLGVIQQAVSVRLRAMGMIQKQGNWVPYELNETLWNRKTLKGDFSLANSCFKDNREKVFCIGLWLEMRSGYSTTTPRRNKYYAKPGQSLPSTSTSTPWPNIRRSCSASGGIKKILFIMSCWNLAIPLRAIGIGYNWFVWAVHCEKNGRNEQRHDKIILLHDNARPHVTKVVKKYLETLKWNVLPAVFSRHCSFWLVIVPKEQQVIGSFAEIENWLQNWIASKDESFFRDGWRKLPERWEKVVGSDGQYFNWSVHLFCFEINVQKTDWTNLYSQ